MTFIKSRITELERKRVKLISDSYLQLHRNTRPEEYSKFEKQILQESLKSSNLHQYPDISKLSKTLADFVSVDEEQIQISSGVDGAIRDTIDIFCSPGDNILYFTPCYMMYKIYSKAYGLNSLELKCNYELQYNFSEIIDALKNNNIKIFFLTNPHSPVDFSLTQEQFIEVADICSKKGTIIFVDEAYHHFGAASFINNILKYDNLIIGRTFSKAFGLPSIRLGFMVASKNLSLLMSSRKMAYETNTLSANLAIHAIENYNLIDEYLREITSSRILIQKHFSNLNLRTHGKNLNSIIVWGFNKKSADYYVELCKKNKIIIKTVSDGFDNYISFTIGDEKSMTKLCNIFT